MHVHRLRTVSSAPSACGHVVVIDVLRAFTTAACALHRGAERIVLVAEPEEAFALRASIPRSVVAGEHRGRKIDGFDFGNSPHDVLAADLTGRTLILRSSSGTQGVVRASSAECVLLGSLVVASATVRHLREHAGVTSLLAMGSPFGGCGDEDDACADWLATHLSGAVPDTAEIVRRVRESDAGRLATNPAADWISPEDLAIAADVDRFDFAMPVRREDGRLVARRAP
jgi:2-phosphosulfolactate phosphatase